MADLGRFASILGKAALGGAGPQGRVALTGILNQERRITAREDELTAINQRASDMLMLGAIREAKGSSQWQTLPQQDRDRLDGIASDMEQRNSVPGFTSIPVQQEAQEDVIDESGISKVSPKDFTPESLQKFRETGDFSDLIAVEKSPFVSTSTTVVNQSLPEGRQDLISQGMNALTLLDVMEENVAETGLVTGKFNQAMGAIGFNPDATAFDTARKQYKLQAQAMIKGIPSNFDVQTVIDTLPAFGSPENVNKSRINTARSLFRQLISDAIAFYKGTKKVIPQEVVLRAREAGIDVGGVDPWDGDGDPMDNSKNLAKKAEADKPKSKIKFKGFKE